MDSLRCASFFFTALSIFHLTLSQQLQAIEPLSHHNKHNRNQHGNKHPHHHSDRRIDRGNPHESNMDRWTEWAAWSSCTQTCGFGISVRTRRCLLNNNHHRKRRPDSGEVWSSDCAGLYKEIQTCNTQLCPSGIPTSRESQCSEFDGKAFMGRQYQWEPFINPKSKCELTCRAKGFRFYARLAATVADGTPCVPGDKDVCIAGQCMTVGCDGMVGSDARFDMCGQCRGDNSTCEVLSGTSTSNRLERGYNTVLEIPAGATNINVTELRSSSNYLAMRIKNSEYVLNGPRLLSSVGEYFAAGTKFTYNKNDENWCPGQCIHAQGPINQTIEVQILYYHRNPGLRYQYSVPKNSTYVLLEGLDPAKAHRRYTDYGSGELDINRIIDDSLDLQNDARSRERNAHNTNPHSGHNADLHRRHHGNRQHTGSRQSVRRHLPFPKYTQSFVFGHKSIIRDRYRKSHLDASREQIGHNFRITSSNIGKQEIITDSSKEVNKHPVDYGRRHHVSTDTPEVQARSTVHLTSNAPGVVRTTPSFRLRSNQPPIQRSYLGTNQELRQSKTHSGKLSNTRMLPHTARHRQHRDRLEEERRRRRLDEERRRRLEEERRNRLETDRRQRLEEERRRRLEHERRQQLAEERRHQLEEERRQQLEEERRRQVPNYDQYGSRQHSRPSHRHSHGQLPDNVKRRYHDPESSSDPNRHHSQHNPRLRTDPARIGHPSHIQAPSGPIASLSGTQPGNQDVPNQLPWTSQNRQLNVQSRPIFLNGNSHTDSRNRALSGTVAKEESRRIKSGVDVENRITPSATFSEGDIDNGLLSPNQIADPDYSWKISGLTACSTTCGGGQQETEIVCVKRSSQVVVTDENCEYTAKPGRQTMVCSQIPCPARWHTSEWSSCSASCDGGFQSRKIHCKRRISPALNLTVASEDCIALPRPVVTQRCGLEPCFQWSPGNWTQCSAPCGKGERSREVTCRNSDENPASEIECVQRMDKPTAVEICDLGSCGTGWFYTPWPTECSAECGEGIQKRKHHCAGPRGETFEDDKCAKFQKPTVERTCKTDLPCGGRWFTGPWGKCNSTCDQGVQTRDVTCMKRLGSDFVTVVQQENCVRDDKPPTERPCEHLAPCGPEWFMRDWDKCSASCGTGYRTREVKCLDTKQRPSPECKQSEKPQVRESCNVHSCRNTEKPIDDSCKDTFSSCHLVVQARLCGYKYYKKVCCASCVRSGQISR